MTTLFRFLEILSLSVWVGGAFFVGVLLAPGAFALLPTRQLAGDVVGMALVRLHWLALSCGAVYVASVFALSTAEWPAWRRAAPLVVVVMLALTLTSQFVLTPRLSALRAQMSAERGSIDATPKEDPLRQRFGQLHGASSAGELLVLLLGVTALFLTVRQQP